jgi:L-alanine-DL-glutamate epimerase-like enolase superfamily enzyme
VRVDAGHITMPELPGIGFEAKSDLYAAMRDLAA